MQSNHSSKKRNYNEVFGASQRSESQQIGAASTNTKQRKMPSEDAQA